MENFVNTVPGENQLSGNDYLRFSVNPNAVKRVLIVGNSITRHNPKATIGWYGEWGMAASCKEKDYVHLVEQGLRTIYGNISLCVAQAAEWECSEHDNKLSLLHEKYQAAANFETDILIIRIGENVNIARTSVPQLADDFRDMIHFFGGNRNGVRVILTGLFWNFAEHEEAVKLVSEQEGYQFVPLVDLGMNDEMTAKGLFEHAGVAGHPGDLGMAHIASRILEAIRE